MDNANMPTPGHSCADCTNRLSHIYPAELEFFKSRFLWGGDKRGVYISNRYEDIRTPDGKLFPKWRPLKKNETTQPLYPRLVDSLAEKHLDLDRFIRTSGEKVPLKTREDEVAFWVGGMANKQTHYHAFDIDSHDLIGWTLIPTRWHPDWTGWAGGGPYDYRYVPLTRPSLRFFMIAKLVYDTFPGRLWSFSSGSLGLAAWHLYDEPQLTDVLFRKFGNRMASIGLNIEQYPQPSSEPPKPGRAHRRPCGMDTGVITANGAVTDSIEQLRLFMKPPATPRFEVILACHLTTLKNRCDSFLKLGGGPVHNRLSYEERASIIDDCWERVELVKEWAKRGYPIDKDVISGEKSPPPASPSTSTNQLTLSHLICGGLIPTEEAESEPVAAEHDPAFLKVDLDTINESGQWVQFVQFLVANGIPAEDRFVEVISTLAKWFCFVELWGQNSERTKAVLHNYVMKKHNGKVTRLNNGHLAEVLAHVDRIVDHVLRTECEQGLALFSEIRRKRATGAYRVILNFEAQIPGDENYEAVASHKASEWVYQPDLTPLPREIEDRIRKAFSDAKRQLRRNRDGHYPTMDAITRFFNYLVAGRTPGARRAGRELLQTMGLPSNGEERNAVLRILQRAGLLHRGSYRSGSASYSWQLSDDVIEALQCRCFM